ncbi:MAG TPA: hypothetical protein VK821_02560 [Dehalococcoidia bacterium]|nr:hypothetical protein [Dehalococcoidia bacterium]
MVRLQVMAARWVTPTNMRAARVALVLAAAILAVVHPGVHVPHVLADDDSGGS